jgi:cystathionine gamma-synthase
MGHHAEGWQAATRAIALGRPQTPDAPLNAPIVPATSFLAGPGAGYSRAGNDTWTAAEAVLGSLEGGQALIFGSGMAAIAASIEVALDRTGSRVPVIASPQVHYSGTRLLLADLARQRRIELRGYTFDEAADAGAAADVLLVESPANPTMDITDIAAAARSTDALVICDNTYATPLATRPLDLGADIVVHSASKYLAGHSDALLGATVTADADLTAALFDQRTRRGAVPGVLEAWLTARGMRTLPLRFAAACGNATEIAARLTAHPDVVEVRYPGLPDDPGHAVAAQQMAAFGAIVTFRPAGGAARAELITRATDLWLHATSLGGVESTLERRRRHTDESDAVPDDLIRLSVGCEDVEDLWQDLASAITSTGAGR